MVTGAAQGIGLAISESLAQKVDYLYMLDCSNEILEENSIKIEKNNKGEVIAETLDITDEEAIKMFFRSIKEKHTHLDILVNNAGISPKTNNSKTLIIDTSLEEWNIVLNTNLTGMFLCVREALPLMMNQEHGRVINMSSQAGRTFSRVASSHYSTSKSGVIGFTRIIAEEYGKFGITANSIAPGRIVSPMTNNVSEETNDKFKNLSPLKRLGTVQEVASVVEYLVSEEAGYITGATIDVNGGMYMN